MRAIYGVVVNGELKRTYKNKNYAIVGAADNGGEYIQLWPVEDERPSDKQKAIEEHAKQIYAAALN